MVNTSQHDFELCIDNMIHIHSEEYQNLLNQIAIAEETLSDLGFKKQSNGTYRYQYIERTDEANGNKE